MDAPSRQKQPLPAAQHCLIDKPRDHLPITDVQRLFPNIRDTVSGILALKDLPTSLGNLVLQSLNYIKTGSLLGIKTFPFFGFLTLIFSLTGITAVVIVGEGKYLWYNLIFN